MYYHIDGKVVVGVDNLTNEAWAEEFDHVVKCKAWLKRDDLEVEKPQIFIEWSEAPELASDSMMDFAKGNEVMEKLEEKYQDDTRYYKTRYHIVFPESENSKMQVINMDRLDIGDGEYLNPYHQVRKEGDLTEEQKMTLESAFYDYLLENEKKDLDEWLKGRNKKGKSQIVDLNMT